MTLLVNNKQVTVYSENELVLNISKKDVDRFTTEEGFNVYLRICDLKAMLLLLEERK